MLDERILAALRTAECLCGLSSLEVKQLAQVTHIRERTIYDRLKRMTPSRVDKCTLSKGYQLSFDEQREATNGEHRHY